MARIVIGYDGSPGAERALRWAATQAELNGALLEIVSCWQFPVAPAAALGPMYVRVAADLAGTTESLVSRACDELVRDHQDLEVRIAVVEGHPARELMTLAEGADLLVIGSSGHGGFASLLLGSVVLHCVANSPCPVVVVRP